MQPVSKPNWRIPGVRAITRFRPFVLASIALLVLTACQHTPPDGNPDGSVYRLADQSTLLTRHAPMLQPQAAEIAHNRPGGFRFQTNSRNQIVLAIDPDVAEVYTLQRDFRTGDGHYRNLIYRWHFEKVPYRLFPFHIAAGRNGGLMVVVTLDSQSRPVLYTTVHSCGCYLAFLPTEHLPPDAVPDDWPSGSQRVYGEVLPARLIVGDAAQKRLLLTLRADTHRVMAADTVTGDDMQAVASVHYLQQKPWNYLQRIPHDGSTHSIYRSRGAGKGHLKNTVKPLERLLMSLWSLDWYVGVDKAYGPAEETGTVFYTSLKPWVRHRSDMWNFPAFLGYWGWKL